MDKNNKKIERTLFDFWLRGEICGFGSFQTRLFEAYKVADSDNTRLLQQAFPNWFLTPYKF